MTTTGDAAAIATKGFVIRRAQARWYDALAALLTLGRDRQLRERLAELARLAAGDQVLDVGCGTGTLAVVAKRAVGAAGGVTGVDASPEMIELATHKAARAGVDVAFRAAAAERLPFADETFDAVLATLMLHHLPGSVRGECVREARRVLKPGGRMFAVDFSRPLNRKGGLLGRLHRHGGVSVDAMVALLRDAGFRIEETGSVGASDLQYVLAVTPRVGDSAVADAVVTTRSLPPLPKPRWIVPAIVVAAIGAHLFVPLAVAARVSLWVGAALAVVVAAHLLGARRKR